MQNRPQAAAPAQISSKTRRGVSTRGESRWIPRSRSCRPERADPWSCQHIVGGHAVFRGVFSGDVQHGGAGCAAGEAAAAQLPGQLQPQIARSGVQLQQRAGAQIGGEHLPHAVPDQVPQLPGQAVVQLGGGGVLDSAAVSDILGLFKFKVLLPATGRGSPVRLRCLVCLGMKKTNTRPAALGETCGVGCRSGLIRRLRAQPV